MSTLCPAAVPKLNEDEIAIAGCRADLAASQQENAVLREELSALDPDFFEQIEDLKHEHHMLQQKYAQLQQMTQAQ